LFPSITRYLRILLLVLGGLALIATVYSYTIGARYRRHNARLDRAAKECAYVRISTVPNGPLDQKSVIIKDRSHIREIANSLKVSTFHLQHDFEHGCVGHLSIEFHLADRIEKFKYDHGSITTIYDLDNPTDADLPSSSCRKLNEILKHYGFSNAQIGLAH
jgi:hypothetical protein